mmetsp:Transcript_38333/g.68494  ORF Transcript_38333/g.68494 Transcript_38333/m.68494 type:complete len:105 (+) Transcript_38333:491-805(+)
MVLHLLFRKDVAGFFTKKAQHPEEKLERSSCPFPPTPTLSYPGPGPLKSPTLGYHFSKNTALDYNNAPTKTILCVYVCVQNIKEYFPRAPTIVHSALLHKLNKC